MGKMHNHQAPKISVFGCGNGLLGDDGFGPAVIADLKDRYVFPWNVILEDAGTGIREYLFDYLLAPDLAPDLIIILDAVNLEGRRPGEVFVINPDSIPAKKIHDFSLHQFPTVNLLKELSEFTGTKIHIVAAQIEYIPDEIRPGLSQAMQQAVRNAGEKVRSLIQEITRENCGVIVPFSTDSR